LDLKGFIPDLVDLIAAAHDLGWHSTQKAHSGRGHYPTVVLHSPVGGQQIRVDAVRQMNERKLATMRSKVVRYGDPVKKALVAAAPDVFLPTVDAYADGRVVPAIPNEVTRPLSERPWLAHKVASKRGGTMYESAAVIERTWASGETDYACAFAGCEYTSVRPRSVSNHYGAKHTQQGEVEPAAQNKVVPVADYTEPLTHRDYTPSDRLVAALTEYLADQMLDGADLGSIAEAALKWAHERPDLPDVEATQREPLTAEQIVERVRMLVGAPLAAVLAEREQRMAEMAEGQRLQSVTIGNLTRQVEDLRAERRALRDLLTEDGGPT
jgi:hypothetical protein